MESNEKKEVRPMLIKRGDSLFDKILAHHSDPLNFPLLPVEQEQLDRWNEAFTLMLNHTSKSMIVKRWVKEKGLSMAQAYIDIKNAELLYGNVLKADKEGKRALWQLWVEDYITRCIQKGDRKGEAKGYDLFAKYSEFDKTDDSKFNPEKLENREIEVKLSKQQEEFMMQHTKGGVADFNKVDVVNIDYEDVTETNEEENS